MPPSRQTLKVNGPAGQIAVHIEGPEKGPVILMAHSILSSSMMWQAQQALLAASGWRVVCADTRGHGLSDCHAASCDMDDLVADSVAVLDGLQIEKAHYVGLSLGGMSGVGLGLQHSDRLLSLVLCDCRADMPSAMGEVWNDRIAGAQKEGCQALAIGTTERWFGVPFLETHAAIGQAFRDTIASTQVAGFVSCARAIQGLNYLEQVPQIKLPTTLMVGANDGPLPAAMQSMQALISGAKLEIIANAGHLPNIDQPQSFNAALMRHFFQNPSWSQA
jgi:3-oxoadipate enol-lactonase